MIPETLGDGRVARVLACHCEQEGCVKTSVGSEGLEPLLGLISKLLVVAVRTSSNLRAPWLASAISLSPDNVQGNK